MDAAGYTRLLCIVWQVKNGVRPVMTAVASAIGLASHVSPHPSPVTIVAQWSVRLFDLGSLNENFELVRAMTPCFQGLSQSQADSIASCAIQSTFAPRGTGKFTGMGPSL